jgi:hypothetical protein
MRIHFSLVILLASGLAGCSDKRKAGEKICQEAADRYVWCVEEILDKEMAAIARSKRDEGIKACAKDEKTQEMYRACLPKKDCDAFMDCLTNYARETGSKPAKGKTRKEQCAHHVRHGLRGVGLQLVMFSETREDDSKRKARSCVLDESKEVESCLNEKEKETFGGYARQRQKDCESWKPELAACVLGLEGAKNCNPDEYPFWREPVIEGPAGPPVAWTIETKEMEYEETEMAWLKDGTLVVLDANGIRGVRAGKELWRKEAKEKDLIAVGKWIATRNGKGALVIRAGKTGKQRAALLADREVRAAVRVKGDKLLVLTGDGRLFRVNPAACKGRSKKCAKPDGSIPEDDVPDEPLLAEIDKGVLVITTSHAARFYDKKRKPWFYVEMADNNEIEFFSAAGKQHVAVTDAMGVALLKPDMCAKGGKRLYLPHAAYVKKSLGYRAGGPPEECDDCRRPPEGCVVTYRGTVNGDWENPIPVADGVVAFNDHGFIEKTHLLTSGGGWEVKTGGHGGVAGDQNHVYTITFAEDEGGQAHVLALARDSGKPAWQTSLPAKRDEIDEYTDTTVVVQRRWLAAHAGKRIYVIDLKSAKK